MDDVFQQSVVVGGQTMAHPIGLVALVFCGYLILFANKHFVIPAILVFVFVIPSAQRVVLLSIDFSFIRIAIILAILRARLNGETKGLRTAAPDRIILLWMVWGIVAYGLLIGSLGAVGTRAGFMVDAVGSYFVGRLYIKSWDDMKRVAMFIGYASIPVLLLFIFERHTGRNLFSTFGGIGEYTLVREGKLRCQGPFSHPIMAGIFWASILPWIAILWIREEKSKPLLLLIGGSISVIVINTASSTPLMAVILLAAGLFFFRFRQLLPALKWILFLFLVAAQLLMDKGAAHLLARANILSGSTGWHRYHLIDEAINHFREWLFFGTKSTFHWGPGLDDVTNQYILEGVRGGIIGMALFIAFLLSILNIIGLAIKSSKSNKDRLTYWCAGVLTLMHVFSFLSASYFGQMVASFFIFSGMIASLSLQKYPIDKP